MVKIVIGNVYSKILGFLPEEVTKELDTVLSYKLLGARFIPSVKSKQWDGVVRLFYKQRGQSFFTGLLAIVREVLKKHGIPFELADNRQRPDINYPELAFVPPKNYESRDYQDFTIDRAYKFTRGILSVCTGGGKCLGEGTKVLMFDGSSKNVESIVVGDLLMGPDSGPRTVISITQGYGDLYLIKQNNGDDFVCNDEHILCLQRTDNSGTRVKSLKREIEITASDFYNSNDTVKHHYKGYKVGVEFKKTALPVDPYWLGLWLGDGTSGSPDITTGDKEIVDYLYKYAKEHALSITEHDGDGCKTYCFVNNPLRKRRKDGSYINPLRNSLLKIGVLNNKHIPDYYKYNDRKSRLQILAGLIDSDGNFSKIGAVEICSTNSLLARDVCWLARSLGFRSSLKPKKTSIKKINYKGLAYRVRISGNISEIPVLLKRKQAGNKTKYAALRYGISVNPIGKGKYFGFEIDGDRKFLLGDFTVTHNTMMVTKLIANIKTYPFIFYVLTKDLMEQAHSVMSKCLNQPVGKIGDGEADIKKISVCTIQTAILALNMGNSKFKISDYSFDDEDKWDENGIENAEKAAKIRKLIGMSRGLFIDECHHVASRTAKEVLLASTNAYWRFGGSATPQRESGDDIMIQAMFGSKIVNINASYLIKRNWLVKPYVFFEPIKTDTSFHSYHKIYETCVVKNDKFNTHVADTAKHLISKGLSVLILVKQYPQGDFLKTLIPNSEFITGRISKMEKRTEIIDKLRNREIMCMIATSLADEGLDIPSLDAVLIAGGGKSSTRLFQRIGRTLRKDKEGKKNKSIVIIYEHDSKYLYKHVQRVRTLLKREPEFIIKNSLGVDFICKELDQVLMVVS